MFRHKHVTKQAGMFLMKNNIYFTNPVYHLTLTLYSVSEYFV